MAGELRYELIGDASRFAAAGSEVVNTAEEVEGSVTELQQQLVTAAEGQAAFNEQAGRYVNEAGEFISAAEGQARILRELNQRGIQTQAQYEAQIQDLQRLAEAVEEGSIAHQQLMRRQEMLQQEMIQAGEAAEQAGGGFSAAMGPANDLGFLLQDLQTFSIDATMGLRSISNNIPGVLLGLQRVEGGLTGFLTSLKGAGGFILAVNAAAAALPILANSLSSSSSEAEEAKEAFDGLFRSSEEGISNLEELSDALQAIDPRASNASAAMSLFRAMLADNIPALRTLNAEVRESGGAMNFLLGALRQVTVGVGALQAEMSQARLLETTRRLRNELQGTGEAARFMRTAFNALGADVNTVVRGSLEDAREEVARFREELNLLFGRPEELIGEAPRAAAEQLEREFQSLRQSLVRQRGLGLIGEEQFLQEQVRFLENALQQASEAVSDPQMFEFAFGNLRRQLVSVREELENVQDQAEETADSLHNVAPEPEGFVPREERIRRRFPVAAGLAELHEQQREERRKWQQFINGFAGEMPEEEPIQEDAFDRLASQFGRVLMAQDAGFEEMGQQLGQSFLQSAREAVVSGDITMQEFRDWKQAAQQAGVEIEQSVNQNLARSIQMASQLGATLIQAAEQGGASFAQVFGAILQTVGGIVGFSNPVAGAALAGGGTLIGSIGNATASPNSQAVSAGAQTRSAQTVQVELRPRALANGDLGFAVRKNRRRRERLGHTT